MDLPKTLNKKYIYMIEDYYYDHSEKSHDLVLKSEYDNGNDGVQLRASTVKQLNEDLSNCFERTTTVVNEFTKVTDVNEYSLLGAVEVTDVKTGLNIDLDEYSEVFTVVSELGDRVRIMNHLGRLYELDKDLFNYCFECPVLDAVESIPVLDVTAVYYQVEDVQVTEMVAFGADPVYILESSFNAVTINGVTDDYVQFFNGPGYPLRCTVIDFKRCFKVSPGESKNTTADVRFSNGYEVEIEYKNGNKKRLQKSHFGVYGAVDTMRTYLLVNDVKMTLVQGTIDFICEDESVNLVYILKGGVRRLRFGYGQTTMADADAIYSEEVAPVVEDLDISDGWTSTQVYSLIQTYVDADGEVVTLDDGVLGHGRLLLTGEGLKAALVQEYFVNSWTSLHTVTLWNELPGTLQDEADAALFDGTAERDDLMTVETLLDAVKMVEDVDLIDASSGCLLWTGTYDDLVDAARVTEFVKYWVSTFEIQGSHLEIMMSQFKGDI